MNYVNMFHAFADCLFCEANKSILGIFSNAIDFQNRIRHKTEIISQYGVCCAIEQVSRYSNKDCEHPRLESYKQLLRDGPWSYREPSRSCCRLSSGSELLDNFSWTYSNAHQGSLPRRHWCLWTARRPGQGTQSLRICCRVAVATRGSTRKALR